MRGSWLFSNPVTIIYVCVCMYVHVLFKALPLVYMAASGESQVVNIAQGKGTKLSTIFVMKFASSIFVMRLS